MNLLEQPTGSRLGDWLNANLGGDWAEFRAGRRVREAVWSQAHCCEIGGFSGRSRKVEVIAGVDHQGTSYEGLRTLMDAVSPNGR